MSARGKIDQLVDVVVVCCFAGLVITRLDFMEGRLTSGEYIQMTQWLVGSVLLRVVMAALFGGKE